jgi:hypothetical protein
MMPNTSEWIQWNDTKWHLLSDNTSRIETICGEFVPQKAGDVHTSILRRQFSETIPDTGDVCLHCVRWLVMKLREA